MDTFSVSAESLERMRTEALKDSNSGYYKGLIKLMKAAEAQEKLARIRQKSVSIPVALSDGVITRLERQFAVSIDCKGNSPRAQLSPSALGLFFCIDAALMEHVGGGIRSALYIDGDLMTIAAAGVDGRIVEKTNGMPRLAVGNVLEEEVLRRVSKSSSIGVAMGAGVLHKEILGGGGEHYWPSVREDGPDVDVVVVNHFRTSVGPHQVAYLAKCRGAYALGAIPFQNEFFFQDEGALDALPGRFYIDRVADILTCVPDDEASMPFSHPYSSLMEVVNNNSITVDGLEFLCEKYCKVSGVVYYSLKPVNVEFETPETLRSYFFNSDSVAMTRLKFLKMKFTDVGVPIGYERSEALIFTDRYSKVMPRLACNTKAIVTPADAFVALMDYNNMTVNTLDSARNAERMEYSDEADLCVALALRANWQRHLSQGTFNALLAAVKLKHGAMQKSTVAFAMMALTAWWRKPRVGDSIEEGDLPVADILDWFGNDFSVLVEPVDPWTEIVQVAGLKGTVDFREFSWFPKVPPTGNGSWFKSVLQRAKVATRTVKVGKVSARRDFLRIGSAGVAGPVCVDECVKAVSSRVDVSQFTDLKKKLRGKMRTEQDAREEAVPDQFIRSYGAMMSPNLGVIPVPDVDPESAIRADFINISGSLPDRDVASTGYRLAELDVSKNVEGSFSINDSKRLIPKGSMIRKPVVDVGVEGARVSSQITLVGAMFKRNIGVPPNRGSVDLAENSNLMVQRTIDVCFRSDWEEIVEKHLNTGMWEPNLEDLDTYVAGLDEKKVTKLLDEFFLEGVSNLDEWRLMAKGKVKAPSSFECGSKVDHPQTILYLESSSTNAMYSSMMKRVKLVFDECLRPEISLNAQESEEEHELWYNSLEAVRKSFVQTFSYSSDIHTYDRSQEHGTLIPEAAFWKRMGLTKYRYDKWIQEHGLKRASAMMFGVVAMLIGGGISGDFKTIFRNGIINLMAVVLSTDIRRDEVVMLDIKGDDMDAEFSRVVNVVRTVEYMSLSMNLSAKFFTNDVRYMCKQFRIKKGGYWYFVSDPVARVFSLLTPIRLGGKEDKMLERWKSLQADLRHYDNGLLVDEVALAAQKHYSIPIAPFGFARALSKVREDRGAFFRLFQAPSYID